MLTHPQIDPVALELGPLDIHWYGLMYLIGFVAAWWLGRLRAGRPGAPMGPQQVEDLIFYGALGVVLGGRFGYVLFYNFEQFLQDPLWLFQVWTGGMSFHGGLLGVLLAMTLFARRHQLTFFQVTDFLAPLVPIGLGAGRIGNFIGQELYGRVADASLPWGMIFPVVGDDQPRHPSQLYEFALEGVVLFILLWWYSARPRPRAAVSAMFLIGYGSFRFFVEFFRQPDAHLQFIALDWVTMGQILSAPMILLGLGMLVWAYRTDSGADAAELNR